MILYLDIDGVLNGHEKQENGYCGTRPDCVSRLNRVLDRYPELGIVVSSAWRYMTFRGEINGAGFEMLLATHGVKALGRVLGFTPRDPVDQEPGHFDRETWDRLGKQWRRDQVRNHAKFKGWEGRYVVVDDLDLGLGPEVFVRTDGSKGLQDEDVEKICDLLERIRLSGV